MSSSKFKSCPQNCVEINEETLRTGIDWQTMAWGPNPACYTFVNKVLLKQNHVHSLTLCLE